MRSDTEKSVQQVVQTLNELKDKELTKLELFALREAASWLLPQSSAHPGGPFAEGMMTFDMSEQKL